MLGIIGQLNISSVWRVHQGRFAGPELTVSGVSEERNPCRFAAASSDRLRVCSD
jgi:hypothetical protein